MRISYGHAGYECRHFFHLCCLAPKFGRENPSESSSHGGESDFIICYFEICVFLSGTSMNCSKLPERLNNGRNVMLSKSSVLKAALAHQPILYRTCSGFAHDFVFRLHFYRLEASAGYPCTPHIWWACFWGARINRCCGTCIVAKVSE